MWCTEPSRSTRTRWTSALPCEAAFICAFSLVSSRGVVSTVVISFFLSASAVGGVGERAQQHGHVVVLLVGVDGEGHRDLRVERGRAGRREVVRDGEGQPVGARLEP